MLKQEVLSKMACYALPDGVTYKAFTGSQLGLENLDRLKSWCKLAGLPYDADSDFDGWFSITLSPEYGKTIWKPGVYAATEDGLPVVVLGNRTVPLATLKGGTLLENNGGFTYFWPDDDEPYFLPLYLLSNVIVSQAKLKKELNKDCSSILRKPMVRYPKLSTLPIGIYWVVGVLNYAGFEGKPSKAIQVEMPDGALVWYQANSKVEEALSWNPEISCDKHATLQVLSHGKTKQGHPMAVVNFSVDVGAESDFFALSPGNQNSIMPVGPTPN